MCIRLGINFSLNARTFALPQKIIYSSQNYKIEPDFPCLADEPRPAMNI